MAISASSLIEDVARYLSDFEEDESYVHWTQEDLLSYFKRAVQIVAITKRDKFIRKLEFPLQVGAVQDIPEACESDVSVYGVLDENGVVQERPRKAKLSTYPKLGRPMCSSKIKSSTGYKMKSYELDPENPRVLLVDPPLKQGDEATLVVSCYQPPHITGMDSTVDIGGDLEPAIFELMLYYAWGVDIEDAATRERSNTHWTNAMTLMKLNTDMQNLARSVRGQL